MDFTKKNNTEYML